MCQARSVHVPVVTFVLVFGLGPRVRARADALVTFDDLATIEEHVRLEPKTASGSELLRRL